MEWAPNPIGLARTVLGALPDGRAWPRSWRETEELLAEAFHADASTVFHGSDSAPAVIDLLRQVRAAVGKPQSLEAILELPAVRALAAHVPHVERLARILPFVAPVEGASFGPPGTGFTLASQPPPIGVYAQIGALDVGGVSWRDPTQGNVADCYLIATMSAIAWARPVMWRQRLSAATQGSKDATMLRVSLHSESDAVSDPAPFDVPPRVPLDAGRNWIFAHSAQSEETWPALLERAYVMQTCRKTNAEPTIDDYRTIGEVRHWPQNAARALIGGVRHSNFASAHERLSSSLPGICVASLTKHPTMAWTHARSERTGWANSGLVDGHAYAVLGTLSAAHKHYVVLRNPFGTNGQVPNAASGDWADGAARNDGQPVTLDEDGVFAIDTKAFDRWFAGLGWIEVPNDPPA